MRRIIPVLFLALALVGVVPVAAEEAPAPVAPATSEDTEEVTLPAELTELLDPEPIEKTGFRYGPCTVSVKCLNGQTISCSGANHCYWKIDHASWPGYVRCDGRNTTCQHNLVPEP